MVGRRTMIVTCTLCGSTFNGLIEPYCFDKDKDPEWQKSLRKYERQKWVVVSVKNHGEYKITSSNKCCTSGKLIDVPRENKIRDYGGEAEIVDDQLIIPTQVQKVIPQTLF